MRRQKEIKQFADCAAQSKYAIFVESRELNARKHAVFAGKFFSAITCFSYFSRSHVDCDVLVSIFWMTILFYCVKMKSQNAAFDSIKFGVCFHLKIELTFVRLFSASSLSPNYSNDQPHVRYAGCWSLAAKTLKFSAHTFIFRRCHLKILFSIHSYFCFLVFCFRLEILDKCLQLLRSTSNRRREINVDLSRRKKMWLYKKISEKGHHLSVLVMSCSDNGKNDSQLLDLFTEMTIYESLSLFFSLELYRFSKKKKKFVFFFHQQNLSV